MSGDVATMKQEQQVVLLLSDKLLNARPGDKGSEGDGWWEDGSAGGDGDDLAYLFGNRSLSRLSRATTASHACCVNVFPLFLRSYDSSPAMDLVKEKPRSLEERRRSSISYPQEKKTYMIGTEKSGDLTVHVQGDISQQDKRAAFLTVHDLGCNHYAFEEFLNKPCMLDIKDRSIFIHIDVPGHEDNAETIPEGKFPDMQTLGEDLVTVLDFLHIKYVIGLGEGAGANVLARFGLAHPPRCLALILINCTGSSTSVMENFKAKFVNWKGKESVSQSAEDYLVFHKFGSQIVKESNEDVENVLSHFKKKLGSSINPQNVKLYVNAFLNRTDLQLKQFKGDVLLITGMNGSFANVVEKLHKDLDKSKATLLKIEKAGDVLSETPAKVAQSILLFCKGQGLLTSITLPGVDRQRTFSGCSFDGDKRKFSRGMSMDDYDKPNLRRLSITTNDSPIQTK